MGQRDKEKEDVRGGGSSGKSGGGGGGCLHYLQVSSHVARRVTDFYCLAMNLPARSSPARVPACPFIYTTHPFSTLHSGGGHGNKVLSLNGFYCQSLTNP